MSVRAPVQVGHGTATNVATLTQDVPAGWDVIVVGSFESDGASYLDAGGCTDTRGNTYSSVSQQVFHVSAGNIEGGWDGRFETPVGGESDIGAAGYLGRFTYSTRVVTPLQAGDTITVPRATHLGVLGTKGLQLFISHPLFFGLSGDEGTLSDASAVGHNWSIAYPFGTTDVPAIPMQAGDLLIGHGVFRFPFAEAASPDYSVNVPPNWHLHANWLGQATGAAAPDGMILTSLRAPTVGLYDFRGSIGPAADAIFSVVVLGFRGTGPIGLWPTNTHTPWWQYQRAHAADGAIRFAGADVAVPPFDTTSAVTSGSADTHFAGADVAVPPFDTTSAVTDTHPALARDPRGEQDILLFTRDSDVYETASANDGLTWKEPTLVFPGGQYPRLDVDRYHLVGTRLIAAYVAGEIHGRLRFPGDSGYSAPFTFSGISPDDDAFDFSFAPEGPGRIVLACSVDGEVKEYESSDWGAHWTLSAS